MTTLYHNLPLNFFDNPLSILLLFSLFNRDTRRLSDPPAYPPQSTPPRFIDLQRSLEKMTFVVILELPRRIGGYIWWSHPPQEGHFLSVPQQPITASSSAETLTDNTITAPGTPTLQPTTPTIPPYQKEIRFGDITCHYISPATI